MKKICSLFLFLLIILAISVPVGATSNDLPEEGMVNGRSVYSYSMGEIQTLLLDYFKENDISLEPGTMDYYSYICEQMLGDTDEGLRNSPYWRLFHSYMAVYKNEAELAYLANYNASMMMNDESILDTDAAQTVAFSNSFLSSTIGEIRNNMLEMDAAAVSEREKVGISPLSLYDASAAVEYALTYADSHNRNYDFFPLADCANFVSQCLLAGGKPMRGSCTSGGAHEDTINWYHIKVGSIIKPFGYSTSWTVCGDFKKYWQTKCSGYYFKSSLPDLVATCSVGDVVQLCDEDTIVPYHTIIISDKSEDSIWYCAHTENRNNVKGTASILKPTENDFIIYKF